MEQGLPNKISSGAKSYSKEQNGHVTEKLPGQNCSSHLKNFSYMNADRSNHVRHIEDWVLEDSMAFKDSRFYKQKKVLIPTHNLTILPADSLFFHGRPLIRRQLSPVSPEEGVSYAFSRNVRRTPEQVIVKTPRTPGRISATQPCRENVVRSSRQDKRRRKLSAVVLPRIRYEGDTSSEDDEALTDRESFNPNEEVESRMHIGTEKRGGKRNQSSVRGSKLRHSSPVNRFGGSSFNVEKMTLKAIPVAEVKDLTELEGDVHWRERRERKQRKTQKLIVGGPRIRNFDFPTFCRTRRDEDEYKYRMPHLDDNVRTMMNSTPFYSNRNRYNLKPPQSLESIRAHLVNRYSECGYGEIPERGFFSPLKDLIDQRLIPAVLPQSPIDLKIKKSPISSPHLRNLDVSVKSNILNSDERSAQQMHQNKFVRNSSDFCTPFCSSLLEAERSQQNLGNSNLNNLHIRDVHVNSLHPSECENSKDIRPLDSSERFEKPFRDSQKNINDDNHKVRTMKEEDDWFEGPHIEQPTQTTDNRTGSTWEESKDPETVESLFCRCPSPDYVVGKIENETFPNVPQQYVLGSDTPRGCSEMKHILLPETGVEIASLVQKSAENHQIKHHDSIPREQTETSVIEDGNSPVLEGKKGFLSDSASKEISNEFSGIAQGEEKLGHGNLSTQNTTDDLRVNNGNVAHRSLRSFSPHLSNKQTDIQDQTKLSREETDSHIVHEREQSVELNGNRAVNQSNQRKCSRKNTSGSNSKSKRMTITGTCKNNKAQKLSSTHTVSPNKKQNLNSFSENFPTTKIKTHKAPSSRKPPLCRRERNKDFRDNPDFVLFRSLELTSVEEESVLYAKFDTEDASHKAYDSPLTDHNNFGEVYYSGFAPERAKSRLVHENSGNLNVRLVSHISELERLRGYGGQKVANLGLGQFHQDLSMRQLSKGWPNFLHHGDISPSYKSYNSFQNTKQRRSKKISPTYSMHTSGQGRYINKKVGHIRRDAKSRDGSKRGFNVDVEKTAGSALSYTSGKSRVYVDDEGFVSEMEDSCFTGLTRESRSVSCPGKGPRLYHTPSCPEVKDRRSKSQGHRRTAAKTLRPLDLDNRQREALHARLAFNNMRLIHNARQGAFSKFYFTRMSVSVLSEDITVNASDYLENEEQTEDSESRQNSEVPMLARLLSNGFVSNGLIERRFEDRCVKHHSIFSSLMTPHELSLTSQAQKETDVGGGSDAMLKCSSCPIQPTRERFIPPPVDYPELILKPSKSSVRLKNDVIRLPPIDLSATSSSVKEDTPPIPEVQKPLPEILPQPPPKEKKTKPEVPLVLTEAEEVKWRSEQRLEMLSTPPSGYTPPRLVLISSRMPWCQSMANAVKRDGHILYIVYDFDSWTFKDILRECRIQLDHFRPGCKPLSVMMISKGGPGYFYLLKNFVMTPQKIKRAWYRGMKDFWKHLADMISKLRPQDAALHLVGTEFETSEQGRKLKYELSRLMLPNKVTVMTTCDNTSQGREQIELYFDYRKYLLWRSKAVSNFDLVEARQVTRSWSSIEEETRRKEAIFGRSHHECAVDDADETPRRAETTNQEAAFVSDMPALHKEDSDTECDFDVNEHVVSADTKELHRFITESSRALEEQRLEENTAQKFQEDDVTKDLHDRFITESSQTQEEQGFEDDTIQTLKEEAVANDLHRFIIESSRALEEQELEGDTTQKFQQDDVTKDPHRYIIKSSGTEEEQKHEENTSKTLKQEAEKSCNNSEMNLGLEAEEGDDRHEIGEKVEGTSHEQNEVLGIKDGLSILG